MELEVESRGWRLAATLDSPPIGTELAGAVVLVHGSGPATRAAPYWLELSSHLTAYGFACLRYDKPGCGESGGDWRQQSFEDRAFESVEMLDVLKRHLPDTACVGLAGGSQGGWIVLLAAARSPAVEFVICYSAAGVTPAEQEEYRVAHHLPAEGYTADETAEALALLRARLVSNRAGVPAELIFEREAPARSQRWFALVGGMEPEGLAFDLPIYDYDPRPALDAVRCGPFPRRSSSSSER
jgi:pimeloyl-ACP methyl ester carboxylesterase